VPTRRPTKKERNRLHWSPSPRRHRLELGAEVVSLGLGAFTAVASQRWYMIVFVVLATTLWMVLQIIWMVLQIIWMVWRQDIEHLVLKTPLMQIEARNDARFGFLVGRYT
jgi:hypothetical protein